MTEITREGDIKLEVISSDVESKQKCKRHNEQLTWEGKKNKKTNRLKTDKKKQYTCRTSDCWKNLKKKKEKKEP